MADVVQAQNGLKKLIRVNIPEGEGVRECGFYSCHTHTHTHTHTHRI